LVSNFRMKLIQDPLYERGTPLRTEAYYLGREEIHQRLSHRESNKNRAATVKDASATENALKKILKAARTQDFWTEKGQGDGESEELGDMSAILKGKNR